VFVEIIEETPEKKPSYSRSFAEDIVKRFTVVTPSGRVGHQTSGVR